MPSFRWLALVPALLVAHLSTAQIPKQKHIEIIRSRGTAWNAAFNARDTTALFGLFAPDAALTTPTGSRTGAVENARSFRALFRQHPDVNWMNKTGLVEVNDQAMVAYETGEWNESWTAAGGTKARVVGKYCLYWKYAANGWVISAAIFTPLFCTDPSCK